MMSGKDINNPKKVIIFWDDEEKEILEKFKTRVSDLELEDSFLIRFLRARERNLENAEKMLRACLAWRKENDIASFLEKTPPKFLKDEYHIWFEHVGKDHEERSVFWLPLGGVRAKECIEAGHKELIHEMVYNLLESASNSINLSERAHQVVCILGLEDLSMKTLMHMETMQCLYKAFQNLEQNYPEILASLVVINAPWYFSIAYNFVKPILSAHTISKLRVFNSTKSKWMEYLESVMPLESIPEKYLDA